MLGNTCCVSYFAKFEFCKNMFYVLITRIRSNFLLSTANSVQSVQKSCPNLAKFCKNKVKIIPKSKNLFELVLDIHNILVDT